jgi:hypothetical protein
MNAKQLRGGLIDGLAVATGPVTISAAGTAISNGRRRRGRPCSRLRAAAQFVVVLISAELFIYLTATYGLVCIGQVADQTVPAEGHVPHRHPCGSPAPDGEQQRGAGEPG